MKINFKIPKEKKTAMSGRGYFYPTKPNHYSPYYPTKPKHNILEDYTKNLSKGWLKQLKSRLGTGMAQCPICDKTVSSKEKCITIYGWEYHIGCMLSYFMGLTGPEYWTKDKIDEYLWKAIAQKV